jgi:hypothetical protein
MPYAPPIAPPPSPTPGPPPAPRPATSGRNLAAGAVLLIAGALSLVSIFVAWFSISFSGATLYFLPGTQLSGSSSGFSIMESYATIQLGPVGALYVAILAFGVIVGVVALIAGVLGIVGGVGRLPIRRHGLVRGLAIVALVVAIVAVASPPALQPYTFQSSSAPGKCIPSNNTSNVCHSFWGSSQGYSWGASTGWYLMIAALTLAIVGLVLWRPGRAMPAPPTPWSLPPPGAA